MRHCSRHTSLYLLSAHCLCSIFSLVPITRRCGGLRSFITAARSCLSPWKLSKPFWGNTRTWILCVAGKVPQGEEVRSEGRFPPCRWGLLGQEAARACVLELRVVMVLSEQVEHSGSSGTPGKVKEVPGTGVASDICSPTGSSCRQAHLSPPPWRMPGPLLGEVTTMGM